jgi:Fungal specific transcription factor domain
VVSSLPFFLLEVKEMTLLQQFFIRSLTEWDIISATVLCRRPLLYLQNIHNLSFGIGVGHLFGCSDVTLSAINQAADLDAWKVEQQALGALSISDLYKGGTRILGRLLAISPQNRTYAGAVADSFLFAAIIYVNVIMSGTSCLGRSNVGAYSGIQEIQKPLDILLEKLKVLIPHIDGLKLVCWPIAIGKLTKVPIS